jgi:hypothetical protein
MKLKVAGTERVFRASADGAEGVVLCLDPGRSDLEGAVHDTLVDALETQAELARTQPLRWVLLAHRSGDRFEQSCQRVIDTITDLGGALELFELDCAESRVDFRSGRPAGR